MNINISDDHLIQSAKDYQKNSSAKYSKFKVGAALVDKEGKIFGGCNIESSSYGLTIWMIHTRKYCGAITGPFGAR